jgi:hypothetical protein
MRDISDSTHYGMCYPFEIKNTETQLELCAKVNKDTGKQELLMLANDVEFHRISCIHTGVCDISFDDFSEKKKSEIALEWARSTRSSEGLREISLEPEDRFEAMKSWTQGIAEAGIDALDLEGTYNLGNDAIYIGLKKFVMRYVDTNKYIREIAEFKHRPTMIANLKNLQTLEFDEKGLLNLIFTYNFDDPNAKCETRYDMDNIIDSIGCKTNLIRYLNTASALPSKIKGELDEFSNCIIDVHNKEREHIDIIMKDFEIKLIESNEPYITFGSEGFDDDDESDKSYEIEPEIIYTSRDFDLGPFVAEYRNNFARNIKKCGARYQFVGDISVDIKKREDGSFYLDDISAEWQQVEFTDFKSNINLPFTDYEKEIVDNDLFITNTSCYGMKISECKESLSIFTENTKGLKDLINHYQKNFA